MPQEVIYASNEGCAGGTSDDSARFHALLDAVPTGSRIVLGNNRYNIKYGGTYSKHFTIEGGGPRSELYWNPTAAGDTLLRFDTTGSAVADRNEEGQLYGPTLRNFRILGKREKLAHALHLYRCDNVRIENLFVEGIAGASLYSDRSREFAIDGFRTRFCGDRATMTPDISVVSVEGSADTSNYQYWANVFSIFPQWDGIYLNNADKIHMTNVMVHMYPSSGSAGFLAPFHAYAVNRFGTDIFQDWLDHFDDATSGGRFCHAVSAANGSTLNVSQLQVVGGSQEKVIFADASQVHVESGWAVGGNSANGYLAYADNAGAVTWDQMFFDGSWQIYGAANGGACGGICRLGPSFSATQLLTPLGTTDEWFGGDLKVKRLIRAMNHMAFSDGSNISFGTSNGTKIGTTSSDKIGIWGATPIARPTVTGAKGGNAALTSLLTQLAAAGLITDSTT